MPVNKEFKLFLISFCSFFLPPCSVPMHPKRQRSTSSPVPDLILPPSNLELVQQFVEDDTYSLALEWIPPNPLPPDALGYNVYTNNVLESQVDGAAVSSVLLTHIPRNQASPTTTLCLCLCICVCPYLGNIYRISGNFCCKENFRPSPSTLKIKVME